MDNNETLEVMDQSMDADLDAAWGDDEETAQDPVETPAEAPKAETPAEPQQKEEAPAQEEPKAADQPRMFTLKNRDETRQVYESDLIAMAQKGWDYDTVRQERDQLRQYRNEADPAYALVKDYAKRAGFGDNVPAYLDFCREQELRATGKTETEAKNIVAQEKREADLVKREQAVSVKEQQQTSEAQRAQQAAEMRRRNIQEFFAAYPNVKPDTIPQEVWAEVAKGVSLTNAYTMHENRRLQAEYAKLQADLAAERQNKVNQASAPGSLGGNTVTEQDELDRIWAEDD